MEVRSKARQVLGRGALQEHSPWGGVHAAVLAAWIFIASDSASIRSFGLTLVHSASYEVGEEPGRALPSDACELGTRREEQVKSSQSCSTPLEP